MTSSPDAGRCGGGPTPGRTSCVFCEIAAGREPATVVRAWPDALAILPRSGGVTTGHTLVLPRAHIPDVTADPVISGAVLARAAELATRPCNLIASAGPEATQTVYHLHVHVIPRRPGDGLALPWNGHSQPTTSPGKPKGSHPSGATDTGRATTTTPDRVAGRGEGVS